MSLSQIITRKLTEAFSPQDLEVIDESHHHEGHAGHRPGGESHFRVKIVADAFIGKLPVARHRLINEVLKDELNGPIHALAIKADAPSGS